MSEKLLAATSVSEEQLGLLTGMLYSEQASVSERHTVIQSATRRYPNATQKARPILGRWIATLSKEHPQDFRSAVEPLIDTLDPTAISELESITQLTLKVSTSYGFVN
jgi:hypothetical protein